MRRLFFGWCCGRRGALSGARLGGLLAALLVHVAMGGAARGVGGAEPPIALVNLRDGDTVRYPTPLLIGTLTDASATAVVVSNDSSTRATNRLAGLAHAGRFKALTELVPGENRLAVRAGEHELRFTLRYEPQTNPYYVRAFYMTDKSGDTKYQTLDPDDRQDHAGKLDTALKLLQSFTAERMHDLGLGRRTFNLEFNAEGRVLVRVEAGDHDAEFYYGLPDQKWYQQVNEWLNRKFPDIHAKNLVIPAYSRFDPESRKARGHTALGGGNLALFSGSALHAWPSSLGEAQTALMDTRAIDGARLHDDSAGRSTRWGLAATTLGAALHELGHAFDLPHSREPRDIMTRGFDHFNRVFTLVEPPSRVNREAIPVTNQNMAFFAPVSAAYLRHSRWFALDQRAFDNGNPPRVRLDSLTDEIVVEAPNGLTYVGFDVNGEAVGHRALAPRGGGEAVEGETGQGDKGPVAEYPRELRLSEKDLREAAGETLVRLRALDAQGLSAQADAPQLFGARHFVRRWRFAKPPRRWKNQNEFVPLEAEDLRELEESARKSELVSFRDGYIDFLPQYPLRTLDVAGYALREIVTPEPRKVRCLLGSDDAARVWLDGKLAHERLALRPPLADEDQFTLDLAAGEHRLLVEVSQAAGGWGMYFRFEDERGRRLRLSDEGLLTPLD